MNEVRFDYLVMRYAIGFIAALGLSVAAYLVATQGWIDSRSVAMLTLLVLAVVQLVVQLICFMHLSLHGRSRNRSLSFAFTILMMLIIVVGSIWIMRNLDYRMGMSGEAMNEYMEAQNKKGF